MRRVSSLVRKTKFERAAEREIRAIERDRDSMFHSGHTVWDALKILLVAAPFGIAAVVGTWWLFANGHPVWGVLAAIFDVFGWFSIISGALTGDVEPW
jgi:hypothetical protein